MNILNLYAGIGGNRRLWGDDHDITAVELDPKIAAIYHDFFPKDKVIVADAHQFLLDHFKEYEFIWASPPCPTHSRMNNINNHKGSSPKYPDMHLYQEILLLSFWFEGMYCIENVISYYDPLVSPIELNSHYYWTNFHIRTNDTRPTRYIRKDQMDERKTIVNFDLSKYTLPKTKVNLMLCNCVEPETGKYIFDQMLLAVKDKKASLFV